MQEEWEGNTNLIPSKPTGWEGHPPVGGTSHPALTNTHSSSKPYLWVFRQLKKVLIDGVGATKLLKKESVGVLKQTWDFNNVNNLLT